MNKALPLDKLKGAVFGEPIAHEYHVVVSHIGSIAIIMLLLLGRIAVLYT